MPTETSRLTHRIGAELGRLLIPQYCPGCGALDTSLCPICTRTLHQPPTRVEHHIPRLARIDNHPPILPVWALTPYDGPVRHILTAWKDHGRGDLTQALTHATAAAAPHLPWPTTPHHARPTLLIPLPSRRAATRTRGFTPATVIADALATALIAHHHPATVINALTTRRTSTQKTLTARDRWDTRSGGVTLRSRTHAQVSNATTVILVDDVITTGASMRHALTSLPTIPGTFVAGFALAVTLTAKPVNKLHGNTR